MSCSVTGVPDMYGVGIRAGFYLQWLSSIFADWVGADIEALGLRFTNAFFVSATFLALIIQVSMNNLTALDIYIILLLTYGAYYYLVPLYVWRLFTGCSPFWDPTRWPRVPMSRGYSLLLFTLLIAVAAFQMWFWCTGINVVKASGLLEGCQQYGFFLAMVPLDNTGFVVVNILLDLGLILACFTLLCLALKVVRPPRYLRKKIEEAKRENPSEERTNALQQLNTLVRLVVVSIVVAATELTIQWNNVIDVNDVLTAGQTIPLFIGAGAVLRVLYVAFLKGDEDENNKHSNSSPRPQSPFDPPQLPIIPPQPHYLIPNLRPGPFDRVPVGHGQDPAAARQAAQRPRDHRSRSQHRP